MPIEKEPVSKVPKNYTPPNSTRYKVKDGDSWVSLARKHGLDPWDLIEANFKTRAPNEVNWYLHEYVGCDVATSDGKNWRFSTSASPGMISIPRADPLHFVVQRMKLIPQDKTMSCWFASGQMLINWRSEITQTSDINHPDPALIARWNKLYDNNPGITNAEIAAYANDLGLQMLGAVTPSPEYVRDLLRTHGPLWVNGKSHITVIAGIRTGLNGIEVLVFDPAKPTLVYGAWHDFYEQYGLTNHTSLDASAGSETSMLYIDSTY